METVYLYMMELWILRDIFKVAESLALEVENTLLIVCVVEEITIPILNWWVGLKNQFYGA